MVPGLARNKRFHAGPTGSFALISADQKSNLSPWALSVIRKGGLVQRQSRRNNRESVITTVDISTPSHHPCFNVSNMNQTQRNGGITTS